MFYRTQGLLVLLIVSQTATYAGPPKGTSGRVMQSGGQSSNHNGMKVTPKVFVPQTGLGTGSHVIKTMPGKFPVGNANPVFGNGGPTIIKGPILGLPKGPILDPGIGNGTVGKPPIKIKPFIPGKGPVLDPGIGNGTVGKPPIKVGPFFPGKGPIIPGKIDPIFSSGGSGPFVPIGGINGKPPIKGGPVFPGGGVIGNGPKGPVDPIFSGGKPKLPKLPGPILDPGIGNGQSPGNGNGNGNGNKKWHPWWGGGWGGWGGNGYCYGGNCGPFPPWWYEPCWYPQWDGCYGHFHCPVIQPCPLPVYYQTVYTVPVVTASTVAVEAGVTSVDLMVMSVKVLEPGTPDMGTLFRVQLGNKGPSDLAAATRVAIFAAKETKTAGELPRTIAAIPSLAAGKTIELDVRFPKEAYGDPMLIVAVELPKGYRDVNEQDNIAQGEIAGLSGMEPAAQ